MLQVDPLGSYLKIGLPPVLKAGSSGIFIKFNKFMKISFGMVNVNDKDYFDF